MTRFLPYPLVTASLLALWLLLNQSVAPGQILLGAIVALGASLSFRFVDPPKFRIKRPASILRLAGLVAADIVRSNISVARIIFGFNRREATSGFVNIPLELRDPYGLAVLACIITSTPGTLWVNLDAARNVLKIHVLDLTDEDEWIQTIKGRYEKLLLEIFE